MYFTTFFVVVAITLSVYAELSNAPLGAAQTIAFLTFPVFIPFIMITVTMDSLIPIVPEVISSIIGILLTYVLYFYLGSIIGWAVSRICSSKK